MNAAKGLGWRLVSDERLEAAVNLYWIDVATIHERFRTILPWQMINHFPGMPNIARKNRLGQNLNRMQKSFPREYGFYPKTWVLPTEMSDFRNQFDNHGNSIGNRVFIIKPDAGCQGRGIFLTRTIENVPTNDNVVAQVYIKRPFLIDGFKFDLRIYVLVTSVKPLRVYLFRDGLVRLCTEKYVRPTKANLDKACMHLTNYAVNKLNSNFHQPEAYNAEDNGDDSSKRALSWFMHLVRERFGEGRAKELWARIGTLSVRTILSIMPTLSREYDQHFKDFEGIPLRPATRAADAGLATEAEEEEEEAAETVEGGESNGVSEETEEINHQSEPGPLPSTRGCRCFEILGLDIMVDSQLRPSLIEVNHLPSFGTDSPLDLDIKRRLMEQVLPALSVQPDDEVAFVAFQRQEAEKRLNSERKGRERELQRERERAEQEERERAERRRQWRIKELQRAARMRQQIAEAAARAEEAAAAARLREESPDDQITPERMAEIKNVLHRLYSEYSPEKVAKIDKLLGKYAGREEEFLRFALQKYCPSFLLDIAVREIVEREEEETLREAERASDQETAVGEVADQEMRLGTPQPGDVSEEVSAFKGSTESSRPLVTYSDRRRPIPRPFNPGRCTFGSRSTRSLSPVQARRVSTQHWRDIGTGADAAEDSAFKTKVLSAYIPSQEDEWMLHEQRFLKEFDRVFPAPVDASAGHVSEEEGYEDLQEPGDDEDGDDAGGQPSAVTAAPKGKFTPASYEEILLHVFTQDKRQFIRLHGTATSRAVSIGLSPVTESSPAREAKSLPPLGNKDKDSAPAQNIFKEKKETNNKSLQSQLEAASRLSKGISAFRSNGTESVAKVLAEQQIQQDFLCNHLDGASLDKTVEQYGVRTVIPNIVRMGRRDGSRINPPPQIAASSVRQQLFHFEPDPTPVSSGIRIEDPLTPGPYNESNSTTISNGIVGRAVAKTVAIRLPKYHGSRDADLIQRQFTGKTNAAEERAQDSIALRNLFPGFF